MDIHIHQVTGIRVVEEYFPENQKINPVAFTLRTIFVEVNGKEQVELKLFSGNEVKLVGLIIDENAEHIPNAKQER